MHFHQILLKNTTLILCDCEGCEKNIFNQENVNLLSKTHLLIELHEFNAKGVSSYLQNLFAMTHTFNIITSIDDNLKCFKKQGENLDFFSDLNFPQLKAAFGEFRPCTMEWLYLHPKQ